MTLTLDPWTLERKGAPSLPCLMASRLALNPSADALPLDMELSFLTARKEEPQHTLLGGVEVGSSNDMTTFGPPQSRRNSKSSSSPGDASTSSPTTPREKTSTAAMPSRKQDQSSSDEGGTLTNGSRCFWCSVTAWTTLAFVVFVFGIVYLNVSDLSTIPQVELIGMSVNHALTVFSNNGNKAEIRMLSGTDKSQAMGFRVDSHGELSLFKVADDLDSLPEILTVGEGGDIDVRESLSAGMLVSTTDGIRFPDGSVMTTAADVSVGLKSPADLNFLAGANASNPESVDASIIMSVHGSEILRVRNDGIFFADYSTDDETNEEEGSTPGGLRRRRHRRRRAAASGSNSLISILPGKVAVDVGNVRVSSSGVKTLKEGDSLEVSPLIVSDKGLSENDKILVSAKASTSRAEGLSFVFEGQFATNKGGDTKLLGGASLISGGDAIVDGGRGETQTNGNVVIGLQSKSVTIGTAHGGDVVIGGDAIANGGRGETQMNGNVVIGLQSKSVTIGTARGGDVVIGKHSINTNIGSNNTDILATNVINIMSRDKITLRAVASLTASSSTSVTVDGGGAVEIKATAENGLVSIGKGTATVEINSAAINLKGTTTFTSKNSGFGADAFKQGGTFTHMATVTARDSRAMILTADGDTDFKGIGGTPVSSYMYPQLEGAVAWTVGRSCALCIMFGSTSGGDFEQRWAQFSVHIEGISVSTTINQRAVVNCAVIEVSDAIDLMASEVVAEVVSGDNNVKMMASTGAFYNGDGIVVLDSSTHDIVKPGVEYMVVCKGTVFGQTEIDVILDKVNFAIRL